MNKQHLDKVGMNFILGPGRCGTSMLMLMLNEHTQAICTPEMKHALYFYSKYKSVTVITQELKEDVARFCTELLNAAKVKVIYTLNLAALLEDLKTGESTNYAALCKRIYLAFEYKSKNPEGITTIIDKNPYYTLSWEKLRIIFPESKFIILIRDHRAFVSSSYHSLDDYKRKRSVFYHAMVWRFHAKKIAEMMDAVPQHCCFITYEELIADTAKTLEKIYNFLGLEPQIENSLNFHKTITEKLSALDLEKQNERVRKKLSDLSRPVYKSGLENWKKKLSPTQVKICDFICGAWAARFKYTGRSSVSVFEKLWFTLAAAPSFLWVWLVFTARPVKLHHHIFVQRRIKKQKSS